MKLNKKLTDKLWGETGPYSQVNLIIQERILDDKTSRVFAVVEAEINPLTFEIVKQNRQARIFKNDVKIQQLLNTAEYRGPALGYIILAFEKHLTGPEIMKEAKKSVDYTRKTLIKMHKFVMDLLDVENKKNSNILTPKI